MIVASRELTLRDGKDDNIKIPIRIFTPEYESTGVCGCRYEVDWPDKKSVKTIYGIDSVQALVLALQTIGAEIYTSNYHKAGRLFFDRPDSGYGFPVMPTLRDMLQGDDAKYL